MGRGVPRQARYIWKPLPPKVCIESSSGRTPAPPGHRRGQRGRLRRLERPGLQPGAAALYWPSFWQQPGREEGGTHMPDDPLKVFKEVDPELLKVMRHT